MATYRFDKYESWYCGGFYQYYSIQEKTLFGWRDRKRFYLGIVDGLGKSWCKEHEDEQKKLMDESINRLIKAGHTVL
jgi:hypothetical protein